MHGCFILFFLLLGMCLVGCGCFAMVVFGLVGLYSVWFGVLRICFCGVGCVELFLGCGFRFAWFVFLWCVLSFFVWWCWCICGGFFFWGLVVLVFWVCVLLSGLGLCLVGSGFLWIIVGLGCGWFLS